MDNEQSLNNRNEEKTGRNSFVEILYVLRSHILIILIITLLCTAGGYLYAKRQKPVYTASVPVQFDIQVNTEGQPNIVSNVNYLIRYIDTAVGICEKGIVLDRANVYYHFYQENYKNAGKSIDNFIRDVKAAYTNEIKENRGAEIPGYEVSPALIAEYRDAWFTAENTSTIYSASKKDADMVIYFSLSVKNLNPTVAREMAYVYTVAADFALNSVLNFGDATAGLKILVDSSRDIGASSNLNTKKPIIIAFVLGLLVSLAVVYMLYLIDNTVKSKEQLELLSGANVIAYIDDVAEVK